MDSYTKILLSYFVFISIVSVFACVFDKISAKVGGRRIRESTLLLLSALGGGVAMYFVMRIIRHKTRHNKFMIGIPIIIILQIIAAVFVMINFSQKW